MIFHLHRWNGTKSCPDLQIGRFVFRNAMIEKGRFEKRSEVGHINIRDTHIIIYHLVRIISRGMEMNISRVIAEI